MNWHPFLIALLAISTLDSWADPSGIKSKLEKTIISEIEFRNVPIQEAVGFLNKSIPWSTNSVIGLDPVIQKSTTTITLTARDISAFQALHMIKSICDLRIHYLSDRVVLSPFCCPEATGKETCPRLVIVRYRSKEIIQVLSQSRQHSTSMPEQSDKSLEEWTVMFLTKTGVCWHTGSSFKIDNRDFAVTIVNTPEEVKKFESLITETDSDLKMKLERLNDDKQPVSEQKSGDRENQD